MWRRAGNGARDGAGLWGAVRELNTVEARENLGGIVTRTVIQSGVRVVREGDLDLPEPAIHSRIHGVVTQDVVTQTGIHLLEFEDADGLRHSVFGQSEIAGLESFDPVAAPAGDGNGFDHQVRADG
jgi:hypothetical protein